MAKQVIAQTNAAVENSGSVINKNTKVATNDFTLSNEENSGILHVCGGDPKSTTPVTINLWQYLFWRI